MRAPEGFIWPGESLSAPLGTLFRDHLLDKSLLAKLFMSESHPSFLF